MLASGIVKSNRTNMMDSFTFRNNSLHDKIVYEKLWQKVDSLDKKGLPKSALEVVEKIYKKAKEDKNSPQYIKAVIYKMK